MGSVVLAYLYRRLHITSNKESKSISGCITLIQLWSYERLVVLGHPERAHNTNTIWPRAMGWAINKRYHDRRMNQYRHLRVYREYLITLIWIG